MDKPYAESCEQNKLPILSVIKPLLALRKTVLEIGSGTGQHAVYFAQNMPHLHWQPTEQRQNLNGINMWRDAASLTNVAEPIELNVSNSNWPKEKYDAVFSANTLHIMHWHEVEAFFSEVINNLNKNALLIIYGPFNYNQQYTSESNARFDAWLKERDPGSGIRHFEEVNDLAMQQGFVIKDDFAMPANNRILCWENSKA